MSGAGHYRNSAAASSDSEEEFSSSDSSSEEEAGVEEAKEQEQREILTPLRVQHQQQEQLLTPIASEGLTETEKVQLVTDIVEAGGIDNIGPDRYPLARLLSEKKEHYSLHKEGKKRQIQNKVNDWKHRDKGRQEYNSYVCSSAPTPSPNHRRTPVSSSRKAKNSSSRKQKNKSSSSLPNPPSIQRTTYTSPNHPRELSYQRPRQEYTRPFNPIPSKLPMSAQRTHLNAAQLVNVDPEFPEKNGPVLLFSFQNHQGPDMVLRNGYMLELQGLDRRWMEMETEAFEAWHVAPNEILLKVPATSYTFLHAVDEEKKGKAAINDDSLVFQQATNVPRNAIAADDARQSKYYRFVFPKDLDNDIFSPDRTPGVFPPMYESYTSFKNYLPNSGESRK